MLERDILGGQVALTPMVENYPGLTQIGGKKLVEILVSHALQYVQIFQGEEVMDISKDHPMTVTTNKRRFITKALLLATGATHKASRRTRGIPAVRSGGQLLQYLRRTAVCRPEGGHGGRRETARSPKPCTLKISVWTSR
ncbi:MAG: hypothetical protein R2860_05205 [Desulfobacterales bacterium]